MHCNCLDALERKPCMQHHKPFRFGVFSHNSTGKQFLITQAQRAEALGYDTFLVPDHIGDAFDPSLALAMVADTTTSLRIGSYVFNNDFRHPLLLARQAMTLDVLSNGRFEMGLGAGWMQSEYEQMALPFDLPGVRIKRMEESLHIMKEYWVGSPLHISGKYYAVNDVHASLRSIQYPCPPLLIGGSGKRLLTLAAQHASIVGFAPKVGAVAIEAHMNDTLVGTDMLKEAVVQKMEWVHAAAGERINDLELNIVVLEVVPTSERQKEAEKLAARFGLSCKQILMSPYFLIGSVEEMCEDLLLRRENFGFSYIVIWEEYLDLFAPIVSLLAGK